MEVESMLWTDDIVGAHDSIIRIGGESLYTIVVDVGMYDKKRNAAAGNRNLHKF